MGINDEYSRDAYNYELAYDSDGSDEFDYELPEEDWQDWYSEELLDAWMALQNHLNENYIRTSAKYPQFVELVLNPRDWYTPDEITPEVELLWQIVAPFTVVKERVLAHNFNAWAKHYIDLM